MDIKKTTKMKMKPLILFLLTASLTLTAFGQSAYQKARKMNVLADKKRFVLAMDRQDQSRSIWRPHFAYVLITEDLTPEQADFLPRSLQAFEAGEMTEELDREAKELFDKELGDRVFTPGAYSELGTMCQKIDFKPKGFTFVLVSTRLPDCDCKQTGTNFSCNGSCDPSNSCAPTTAGCSIFWAYPCDGKCYNTREG